jgi:glycosyltransferase involved in cell wall biosynthesis
MKRIRVLYIIDALGPGGAERRLVQLLKGLDKEVFSTKLVLLTDIVHYAEIHDLDTEVIKLERKIKKDPSIWVRLYRICRKWRPDIIHAWGSMTAIYAGPVAKLMRVKLINAMIADAPVRLDAKHKSRSLLSFPLSDVIQANSYAGLRAYGAPAAKGHVVHNGFDFERIVNLKDRREMLQGLKITTRFVVGMVAGFRYHKDYDSLIAAASAILERRDDVTFVCVGDGPELVRIRNLVAGSARIIFTGRRNDVESLINIFDIGILLTDLDQHGEGISNSIMEYMALRKPVIATDGGGTGELMVDGETGFLIPQKSPGMLAEKIDTLLSNDALRETMGLAGEKRIREKFSIHAMIDGHVSLYMSLVGARD